MGCSRGANFCSLRVLVSCSDTLRAGGSTAGSHRRLYVKASNTSSPPNRSAQWKAWSCSETAELWLVLLL